MDCGSAPFDFDKKNDLNYFVIFLWALFLLQLSRKLSRFFDQFGISRRRMLNQPDSNMRA